MKRAGILALILCSVLAVGAEETFPEEEIPRFGGCYFARMTAAPLWRMRDQDGSIHEFEPHEKRPGLLVGRCGWTAQPDKAGNVTVKTPPFVQPKLVYHFKNGRLAEAEINGKRCRFNYSEPLVYEDEKIIPLWPETSADAEREAKEAMSAKWRFGGRSCYGFASPNQAGAVAAVLTLVLLSLALGRRSGRILRIFFGIGSLCCLVLLVTTASRGALVALVAGAVPVVACALRERGRLSPKTALISLGAILLMAAGVMGVSYVKVRSAKGDKASDSLRIEILKAAPRMIWDAPNGWGMRKDVGRAYTDWYQPHENRRRMFNLVNDHLTTLVALGWWRGVLYCFAWFAGLALLGLFAWRGGSSVPLGAWTALGVAAAFNVLLYVRFVSWIPIATLALLAFDRRWLTRTCLWKSGIVGLAGALVTMGTLVWVGSQTRTDAPPVHHADGRTVVNGTASDICVVGDPEVLGLTTVHAEIRRFYEEVPKMPAIGYVTDLASVPSEGVRRLVLVGRRGEEFLSRLSKGAVRSLPPEIVFLAPPFGSSAIPDALRKATRVRLVIGEFAARYFQDYAIMRPWVVLVPGAECYIPGWMRFCVVDNKGGRK